MFKTKDIMTKGAICVRKDTPISEAIQIMVNNGITGVPVVDEDKVLVGILTEQKVLRLFHKPGTKFTDREFLLRYLRHMSVRSELVR